MFRRALALAFILLAVTACSRKVPVFDPGTVWLDVGQSTVVQVGYRTDLGAGPALGPEHWIFYSVDPAVAAVEGERNGMPVGAMTITALSPGTTYGAIRDFDTYYSALIHVRCGTEDPIQPALAQQFATTREPVTLRAVTPIAHRTTFTWYLGRTGDLSHPINASGPEIAFVTNDVGTHYVWVLATTPCSSSSAEFRVDARAAKRRAVG